jgi:hypothetical protein
MTDPHESYRTYACPECSSEQAAEEKVAIVYAEQSFRSYGEPEHGVKEAAAKHLAIVSAEKFLRDGLIEISQERRGDDIVFRSRLGVVSPKVVNRIEKRAFDKMKEFLGGVLSKATESIAVWGRDYTGNEGMISKGQAIDYVNAAFRQHLKQQEEKS